MYYYGPSLDVFMAFPFIANFDYYCFLFLRCFYSSQHLNFLGPIKYQQCMQIVPSSSACIM